MQVLTQIKDQLVLNKTLAQINKSLSLKDLIAKVVEVVDKTFTMITVSRTPMPTPMTRKSARNNGIINSIFSRLKNVFNNQRPTIT